MGLSDGASVNYLHRREDQIADTITAIFSYLAQAGHLIPLIVAYQHPNAIISRGLIVWYMKIIGITVALAAKGDGSVAGSSDINAIGYQRSSIIIRDVVKIGPTLPAVGRKQLRPGGGAQIGITRPIGVDHNGVIDQSAYR